MKKKILLAASLAIVVALYCAVLFPRIFHGPIFFNWRNSSFSDFMEIDGMAYSKCWVSIINQTDEKAYVRISATADFWDRHTLYAQKNLTGYTQDMRSDIFSVEPGENLLPVYFGAPYGGKYMRSSRTLPWNIRVEVVSENNPGIAYISEEQSYGGKTLLNRIDIQAGKTKFEYDFDRDGELEQISYSVEEMKSSNVASGNRLQFALFDNGILADTLAIETSLDENCIDSILLHDFGFSDGSLELIVCFQYPSAVCFTDGPESAEIHYGACLIRVVDGQLFADTGSIYGSGSYQYAPAEVQSGRLYSISGNRVTLERSQAPIRIDLSDSIS